MTSIEHLKDPILYAGDPRQQLVNGLVRGDSSPANGEWLADQFPEVVEYSKILHEELIPQEIHTGISRGDERLAKRRGMKNAGEYMGAATTTYAYLLSNFPDRIDEAIDGISAHVSARISSPPELVENLIRDQLVIATPYVERTQRVNEGVVETPKIISEILADNPRSRYEVAQILIAAGTAKQLGSDDVEMLQSFADIAIGTLPEDPEDHIGFFPDELMSGWYDEFILEDLIGGLENAERAGFNSLAKTIRLVGKVAGISQPQELATRLYYNKDFWTSPMRHDFESVKTLLANAFLEAFKETRDRVGRSGYMPLSAYDSYEEAVQELQDNTTLTMASLIPVMGGSVPRALQTEALQLKSKKRKRRNVVGDEIPTLEVNPDVLPDRQLNGAIFTTEGVVCGGAAELQQVVEKFTNGTATEQFGQDIESVMGFLQKLDLSKGVVRGVKQFHSQVLVNGSKLPMYSLKPTDAHGLPTKTPLMKNCRIFFTIPDEESVLVLGISDRKDVAVWEKRLSAAS